MTRALSVTMAAVVTVACSSSTAPSPGVRVSLAGPATASGFLTTAGSNTVYQCNVTLTATATGGGSGDVATWQDGYLRFTHFDGTVDTVAYAGAQRFFDGHPTQLATGTTITGTNDYFYSGTQRPFQMHMVLFYSAPRVNRDSATYDLACQ